MAAAVAPQRAARKEAGEGLDTKMLIIIGLGVLSVILLVLMILQKGKKGVQAQGAVYPPGPIPPYPYPPPPRRRRRRRKKESKKEAKEESKEEVAEKPKEVDQENNGASESAPVSPAQVAAMESQNEITNDSVTQVTDDPNVLKSEIDDIRKSVVSMSVGQPARTSTIVKEWLEQPAPEASSPEESSNDDGGEEEESSEE